MRIVPVIIGVLSLAALEVVSSSDAAINRTSGLIGGAGGAIRRFIDPNIALLPNYHDSSAPLHGQTTSGAPTKAATPSTTTYPADFVGPIPTSAARAAAVRVGHPLTP